MYQSKIARLWIELSFLPWGSLCLLPIQNQHSSAAALLTDLLSAPVPAWFAGQPPAVYRPCSWTQDVDPHAVSLLNLIMYNVTMTTSTNAALLHKCFLVPDDLQFCRCIMFLFLHSGERKYILFALCLSNSWSTWLPCSASFSASCKYLNESYLDHCWMLT